MKSRVFLCLCVLLAGCASTRQFAHDHPIVTGIGLAALAGSIAASANHGDSNRQPQTGAAIGPGPSCTPQPNGSCR